MWQRVLVSMLLVGALAGCEEPPYINIDNEELKLLLANGVPLYDVRRAEEWAQTGVVAGSRKLTFVDAEGRLNPGFLPLFSAEVAQDEPVILICRTGNRTDTLGRLLVEQLGYTQVYNVRDGIKRWISADNSVVKDESRVE